MNDLITTEISPELVLILQCARHHLGSKCQYQLQRLVNHPELDWSKVLKLASFHRLLPILHKVLSSDQSLKIPDSILKALHSYQLKNIHKNFSLLKELKDFLGVLDAHHIKAITFKGPMTAVSAYGDLSLRSFSDLDLLVHPDDFLRLRTIAIDQGYQCDKLMATSERECLKQLDALEQAAYFKSQKEYSLFKRHIFLDIHQGILSKQFLPLFDTRWIWQHTQMLTIAGQQVLGLTPELQVLVSVAQGAEEYWPKLGKLFDLAMLMARYPNLSWHTLISLSQDLDILPRLLLGLSLVESLYGLTLPDSVNSQIRTLPSIQGIAQTVQDNLLFNRQCHVNSRLTMGVFLYQLRLMHNWKNRVRCVLTLMNPTLADIAAIPLPKPLFFIYYMLRPLRLMQGMVWHQSKA
ncbi:MAG: nucleotidyltransferase family protein [Cyanobacteria bacterium P01_C01_bin.118]